MCLKTLTWHPELDATLGQIHQNPAAYAGRAATASISIRAPGARPA